MEQKDTNASIERFIRDLGNPDGMIRQHARHALIKIGAPAVDPLIDAYRTGDKIVHYEAAEALSRIRSAKAIETFIQALEDDDFSVRWVAAEGLIAIGRPAVKPLLEVLERRSDSTWIRDGAHHVLNDLVTQDLVDWQTKKILQPVLDAYQHFEPEEYLPSAADQALGKL